MAEQVCDTKTFTIYLKEAPPPVALIKPRIVITGFPSSAEKGEEISGTVTIYNDNDVKVEAITDIQVSKEDGTFVSVATFPERDVVLGWGPHSSKTWKVTTEWKWGAMPGYDWTFKVHCCFYPMGTYLI